jgi:hypothetical protein
MRPAHRAARASTDKRLKTNDIERRIACAFAYRPASAGTFAARRKHGVAIA